MESNKEQTLIMHSMCRNEIDLLKVNLDKFIHESERCQRLLSNVGVIGGEGQISNIFGLLVFDRYMTQLVTVLNMARKFNIHLEINNLQHTVINASSNGCLDDGNFTQTRLLKDFIEWRNTRLENYISFDRGFSTCSGRIKMAEHLPVINTNVVSSSVQNKDVNSLVVNSNKFTKYKTELNNNRLTKNYTEINDEILTKKSNDLENKIKIFLKVLLPTKKLDHFRNGCEFNAYIVYVQDYKKREFYICHIEDYKILCDLSSNINFKPISRDSLSPDDVFCVLEKRNTSTRDCIWRAVLVPDDETCETKNFVYLLDFGEIIPLTDNCVTYEAPLRYREIPPLAVKCILEGIEDSYSKCIITDQNKCEQVLYKYEFEKTAFHLVQKREQVLHVIKLEEVTKKCDISTSTNNAPSNPFLKADYLKNDLNLSYNSESDVELQLPRSMIYNVSPTNTPVLNICAKVGDKLQIIVTHIVSPISFYAIIQNDYCSDCKIFSWHDQQVFPFQKQMSKPPKLNDIVLSQYVKDDYWYRAKVIDIDLKNDRYKVFYVDFGNTEDVPLSNLAKCSKEQLKDPLRAVLFYLSNLSLIPNVEEQNQTKSYSLKSLVRSAIENMVVMILDQVLNVEVVERHTDDLVVRLIDDQYVDIPKMLFNMGVVKQT